MRERLSATAAVLLLLAATLACKKSAETKAQEQAHADRLAQDKLDLDEKFRKLCKVKDGGAIAALDDDAIKEHCHAMASLDLKVPGSGDFPSDSDTGFTTDDGCTRIMSSYVDAKNAFGVVVRTPYKCTYDPRVGIAVIKF